MTNVSATPEKVAIRRGLRAAAEAALREQGNKVERVQGAGKSSLRRITKGGVSKLVSIRTTQDRWIAFPRNKQDTGFTTLEEVDFVVAASVDDQHNPRFAKIHFLPGDEMRERFERAYHARKGAGYTLPSGRGVWVSLYEQEMSDPVNRVGAGAGLKHPAIAEMPLDAVEGVPDEDDDAETDVEALGARIAEPPLTIAEAKRRLALSLGVPEASITITITG
ncbi:MAG TPA: hypothetical protein VGG10_02465 [Rhizomicrobium sp.]|jgi:hypothetical protein